MIGLRFVVRRALGLLLVREINRARWLRHSLDPRFLRFTFLHFPLFFSLLFLQQAVLFMYGTWIVTATFDRSSVNSVSVHCLRTHKFHFLSIFSLKMGPTVLFTYLKIILLQCFQFLVFNFRKINSIQINP